MRKDLLLYAAVTLLYAIGSFLFWRKNVQKLGNAIVLSKGKAKTYKRIQTLIVLLAGIGISIYCLCSYKRTSQVFTEYVMVAVLGILSGSFASNAIMYALPLGIYENGALCVGGMVLFSNIYKYEITNTSDSEIRMVTFYYKRKILRQSSCLYLGLDDVRRAKSHLHRFAEVQQG